MQNRENKANSPQLTMYGYPKCSTCRNAVKWLERAGREVEMHDLWVEAPSAEVIASLISLSGMPIQKFFNVSGEVYRELKLKDQLPAMTDQEKIALLASNGKLIKRPIVTDGEQVTIGFKEAEYEQAWQN